MGVHDLWRLLAPCGHRVSIDTLASSKLAVDVAIWLVQFIKALRDPSGQPIPNAHIVGLLRRLLRLLYHGVSPVFVFDGPAPRLKKQTIAARQKQRQQHGDSIKRMAEKILLSQLKMRSVNQLRKKLAEREKGNVPTEDGGDQKTESKKKKRRRKADATSATKSATAGNTAADAIDVDMDDAATPAPAAAVSAIQPAADDQIEWEDESKSAAPAAASSISSSSWRPQFSEYEPDDHKSGDDDEPPSFTEMPPDLPEGDSDEENAAAQGAPGEDADAHFVLPADGKVDAQVLAKLPISLQYQVLQQQREHNRFHNFHKFSAVEHDPDAFSSMQMAGFLKSVQFSQSIDNIRKEMNLTVGPGGVPLGPASSSASGTTATAKDGSKLVVDQGRPASGSFVYFKSTVASSQPFSWRESIKNKRIRDSYQARRAQIKGEQEGGANERLIEKEEQQEAERQWQLREKAEQEQNDEEVMDLSPQHVSSSYSLAAHAAPRPSSFLARSIATASTTSNADWLCTYCAAVNRDLSKLHTDAAKKLCQTCGRKREEPEDEDKMDAQDNTSQQRAPRPFNTKSVIPSFPLPSNANVRKAKKDSFLRPSTVPNSATKVKDEWQSPAERYGGSTSKLVASPSPPPAAVSYSLTPTTAERSPARPVSKRSSVLTDEDMPELEGSSSPDPVPATEDIAPRVCTQCTFINPPTTQACQMCHLPLTLAAAAGANIGKVTASFQSKALRKLQHAQQREEAIDFTVDDSVRITHTPPNQQQSPPRDLPSAPTVAASVAPAAPVLDISFETAAVREDLDEVDDLFATATRGGVKSRPVAAPAQPVPPLGFSSASGRPIIPVTPEGAPSSVPSAVAAPPIDPDFLEVSEGEEEAVARVAAAEKTNQDRAQARKQHMEAARQKSEEEQIRLALAASLKDVDERTSTRGVGISFGAAPVPITSAPSSDTANLAPIGLPSSSDAMVDNDDVEWVEDEDVIPIAPPVPTRTQEEDGFGEMEIDSDEEQAKPSPSKSQAQVKVETSAEAVPVPISRSIVAPASAPTVTSIVAPVASASTQADVPMEVDEPKDASTQQHALASTQPVAHGAIAPPVSPPPATAAKSPVPTPAPSHSSLVAAAKPKHRSPFFPRSLSQDQTNSSADNLANVTVDDDAETRKDKEELKKLLGEIQEIEQEVQEAKEMVGEEEGAGAEGDTAQPSQVASAAVLSPDEDETMMSTDEAVEIAATATPATKPTVSALGGLVLPRGVTINTPPSSVYSQSLGHSAFLQSQAQKRTLEAEAAKRRQEEEDHAALAALLPDDAAAVPLASTDEPMVYEAFPSHISASDAVALAQSFDSSYLESSDAQKQQANAIRGEAHVTEEMLEDSKKLLQLFGIPYIEAPGEAEAQCATLEMLGLVDGIITDDSDVFLFGARQVYRHFFESKKFCEKYSMDEVTAKLGMDRRKLIHFAMLLGSDYTAGVKGIGVVNATEILNAFPGEHGLEELRDWIWSSEPDREPNLPVYPDPCSLEERAKLDQEYRVKLFKYQHRNLKRSWAISRDTFPNKEVIDGYLHPNVDDRASEFTWAQPDWEEITKLCREKLQWSAEEVSAQFTPVQKAMDAARQTALDRFFGPNDSFAVIASDRLNRALKGLVNQTLTAEELQHQANLQSRKEAQAEKRREAARAKKRKASGAINNSLLDAEFDLSAEDEALLAAVEAAANRTSNITHAGEVNPPVPTSASSTTTASSTDNASSLATKPRKSSSKPRRQKSTRKEDE